MVQTCHCYSNHILFNFDPKNSALKSITDQPAADLLEHSNLGFVTANYSQLSLVFTTSLLEDKILKVIYSH